MKRKVDPNDIVGERFGSLTVLECVGKRKGHLYYDCLCDCGARREVYRNNLLRGFSKSCQRCRKPRIEEEGDHMRYHCASGGSFIFDKEDIEKVMSRQWFISSLGYVVHTAHSGGKSKDGKRISKVEWLSRFLMEAPENGEVDHINGDRLDNRRQNLRIVTSSQNNRNQRLRSNNTTGYKGVYYIARANRYSAELRADGTKHYLGIYKTPEEAAQAYDDGARRIHGEYACLNFPNQGERGCR